jgi:hypothetical protein
LTVQVPIYSVREAAGQAFEEIPEIAKPDIHFLQTLRKPSRLGEDEPIIKPGDIVMLHSPRPLQALRGALKVSHLIISPPDIGPYSCM